jgi:hypothetical protein
MSKKLMGRFWIASIAIVGLAWVGGNARALSLPSMNLVDLMRESESIVVGTVTSVTDGIDDIGLPYTEITLNIEETILGSPSGTYTFRQIGLQTARLTADGTKLMLPAPEGIPRYTVGEHVLLFLGEPASLTGLRSTAGLGYGKFLVGGGQAINDLGNEGVFQNISLATSVATANNNRILSTTIGAVNPDDFLTLVRNAVQNHWLATCQMWKTGETPVCPAPPMQKRLKQPNSTLPKSGTTVLGGPTIIRN